MIPKKKDEQVKNLEWTKLKGLLGEKALDRQSKEKQHSEELGFKSDQLQAQKQQNSFDNKLKLAELIGKKPSKKSIYTTVAENFGSKGYGAFFKGLFSALGHKDQEEMSEKQANEMMKYLQQAEAIDYIKNTNEQLDQMYKKAQLQKQADEYFQSSYEKILNLNLPNSEKQNVIGQVVKRAGEMAGEQKTLDGIGNNGDLYIQNQKGNITKVAVDPVENAISNYRDLQNNYQYPQSNSSNPYQKLVNDQNQTRINYDQNGRMRTQQPQNPMQAEQRQENIQQDSQQEQPKEEPWMKYMSEAENNVYREPNASEYKPEELKPFIEREAKKLYFEDQKEQKKSASERERVNYEIQAKNFHKNFDEFNSNKNGVSQLMNYDALNKNEKFFDQMENIIKNNKTQGLPEGFFKDFLNVLTNNRASNQLISKLETEGFASVKDYVFKDSRLTDQDAQIIMNLVPKASDTKEVALQKLNDLVIALKSQKQKIENNYTILRKGLEKFDPESLSLFEEQNQEIINGIKLKQQSKNKENSQEQSQEEFNNEQQKYSIKKENGKVNFTLGDKQVELTQNQVEQLGDIADLKGKNIEFTEDQLQTLGLSEKKTTNPITQNVGSLVHGVGLGLASLVENPDVAIGFRFGGFPGAGAGLFSLIARNYFGLNVDVLSKAVEKYAVPLVEKLGYDPKDMTIVNKISKSIGETLPGVGGVFTKANLWASGIAGTLVALKDEVTTNPVIKFFTDLPIHIMSIIQGKKITDKGVKTYSKDIFEGWKHIYQNDLVDRLLNSNFMVDYLHKAIDPERYQSIKNLPEFLQKLFNGQVFFKDGSRVQKAMQKNEGVGALKDPNSLENLSSEIQTREANLYSDVSQKANVPNIEPQKAPIPLEEVSNEDVSRLVNDASKEIANVVDTNIYANKNQKNFTERVSNAISDIVDSTKNTYEKWSKRFGENDIYSDSNKTLENITQNSKENVSNFNKSIQNFFSKLVRANDEVGLRASNKVWITAQKTYNPLIEDLNNRLKKMQQKYQKAIEMGDEKAFENLTDSFDELKTKFNLKDNVLNKIINNQVDGKFFKNIDDLKPGIKGSIEDHPVEITRHQLKSLYKVIGLFNEIPIYKAQVAVKDLKGVLTPDPKYDWNTRTKGIVQDIINSFNNAGSDAKKVYNLLQDRSDDMSSPVSNLIRDFRKTGQGEDAFNSMAKKIGNLSTEKYNLFKNSFVGNAEKMQETIKNMALIHVGNKIKGSNPKSLMSFLDNRKNFIVNLVGEEKFNQLYKNADEAINLFNQTIEKEKAKESLNKFANDITQILNSKNPSFNVVGSFQNFVKKLVDPKNYNESLKIFSEAKLNKFYEISQKIDAQKSQQQANLKINETAFQEAEAYKSQLTSFKDQLQSATNRKRPSYSEEEAIKEFKNLFNHKNRDTLEQLFENKDIKDLFEKMKNIDDLKSQVKEAKKIKIKEKENTTFLEKLWQNINSNYLILPALKMFGWESIAVGATSKLIGKKFNEGLSKKLQNKEYFNRILNNEKIAKQPKPPIDRNILLKSIEKSARLSGDND